MKNYLLTVFGDFKVKKLTERIMKGMEMIVDSKHVKYFQHNNSVILFHFGSEVSPEEIYDYVTGIFYGMADTFILTEVTDKKSVYAPDNIKAHLLDLENDTQNVENIDSTVRMDKQVDDFSGLAEDFVGFLLDEMEQEIKVPTLNQILDKISENGISSLSPFEKEILDEYSKN